MSLLREEKTHYFKLMNINNKLFVSKHSYRGKLFFLEKFLCSGFKMNFSMSPKFFLDPDFLHISSCKLSNVILTHVCPLCPALSTKQTKVNNKVPLFLLLGFLSRLMIPLHIQMGEAKPYDQYFKLFWLPMSFHSGYKMHILVRENHSLAL